MRSDAVDRLALALADVIREAGSASPAAPLPPAPLSVKQLAARYGRKEVTIRSWLEAGRFPRAFRLGREWRVPVTALAAFDASGPAPGVALVNRVYGHLGTRRHRADVVEYRVTQHKKATVHDQTVAEWLAVLR